MRGITRSTLLILSLLLAGCGESNPAAETAGNQAALAWLAIVDAQDYATSWQEAAPLFKSQLSEEQWVKMIAGVRSPLGQLQSRTLSKTRYATSLPGAADGEYVVNLFDTTFENKSSAVETVTVVDTGNGDWRVTGYFIR